MARDDTRRYSLEELEAKRANAETRTRADAPPVDIDEEFWRQARIVMPGDRPKVPVSLRLDSDIVAYFKQQGRGYQTRINAVLRSYVEAQRGH